MRHRFAVVVGLVALLFAGVPVVSSAATEAPANDNYVDAAIIGGLPFSDVVDVDGATAEPLETAPSCGTNPPAPFPAIAGPVAGVELSSVWYRFEPTVDTTFTVDPTASDFTLAVGIYDGTDMATQQHVGCARSDVGSGTVTVDVDAGHSYAIQFTRIGSEGTTLSFTVNAGSPVILPPDPAFRADDAPDPATGDATVVAVIDTGMSPYHWDFLASRMPQALDGNPRNDLPLDQPPHTWLPGFPDPATFGSYESLDVTLEEADPRPTHADLRQADEAEWEGVTPSAPDDIHYSWVPGTKLIGAITFSPDGRIEPPDGIRHGQPVASAAVGNYVGTCPECLLVFIQMLPAETAEERNQQTIAAMTWAFAQPWIDVVSSSQAIVLSTPPPPVGEPLPSDLTYWNFVEAMVDVETQRAAVERGQTLFQASANGIDHQFVVPNPVLANSHMGPDWLITVGGVDQAGRHVSGTGKPVDVAGVAIDYPVADTDAGVGEHRRWNGTSFATPSVAGTYANALYHARRALPGPSRAQDGGVVARARRPGATGGNGQAGGAQPPGRMFRCGSVRPDCELADGILAADELRTRLLHGVLPSGSGATRTPLGAPPGSTPDAAPTADEWTLANQGHGVYFGRAQADGDWLAEADGVLAPLQGLAPGLERPTGEREWMIVDSFCRQEIWGTWDGGYYVSGVTPLPGPDHAWPLRTTTETTCPHLPLPVPDPSAATVPAP